MDTSEFVKLTRKTVADLLEHSHPDSADEEPLRRRREPRWPFPGTVELWVPEPDGTERQIFATSINVSLNGLAIRCDEGIALGTSLPIAVHLPQATYLGHAVARHISETPSDFLIGLQFTFER